MKTLLIKNLTKRYEVGKDKVFVAIKPTNLSFDSTGLVSIVGKSGSGKSTLINLLAKIDKPSEGEIFYYGKPYSTFKKKDNPQFFNKEIGIVFQNYNLLDDETVLMNVMLPALIGGTRKIIAKEQAMETLEKVNIPHDLFEKRASKLSGGERQRVGIARAIVNKPKIVFCDEPTGALDSSNSEKVMEILKEISKTSLVLLVSHNPQIVKKYSDRIIEIEDGLVINDQLLKETSDNIRPLKEKRKNGGSWINVIASNNYKKRIKRNLFSTASLTITLTMFNLVCGFLNNKDNSIREACYKQFDFGAGTISEEMSIGGNGLLSLTKSTRPKLDDLMSKTEISKKYNICVNFSSILPQNIQISYDNQELDDLIFTPIYSFDRQYVDSNLLVNGFLPYEDNLSNVVINTAAYNMIKNAIGKDPLNELLTIDYRTDSVYVTELEEYVKDTFYLSTSIKVTGVVREINYLPSPKIYYSYCALEEYMKESILTNLSTYFDNDITWFDRVFNAENHSYISSYSYQLFLKDINDKSTVFDKSIFPGNYSFTSQSLILTESLFNFLEVTEYGVILFLIITIIGAVLILSIMSFANFSDDHKESAILTSVGATEEEIQEIYLQESMVNGFLALFLSTAFSFIFAFVINLIISKFIDLHSLIKIPFLMFMGHKFLFPIIIVLFVLLISSLSTIIPILFSKKKSVKGELQSL
jgi:ABC-type lipoprotein export system ATPase subunit/ABC-type antimicrobial peptide transport system permease subunit